MRDSVYRGRGYDTEAHTSSEIKGRKCENADSESVYNESHLYRNEASSYEYAPVLHGIQRGVRDFRKKTEFGLNWEHEKQRVCIKTVKAETVDGSYERK
jgi:hypothetical protein